MTYDDLAREVLDALDPWMTDEQRDYAESAFSAGEPVVAIWDAGPALALADEQTRRRISTLVMDNVDEDDIAYEEVADYYANQSGLATS